MIFFAIKGLFFAVKNDGEVFLRDYFCILEILYAKDPRNTFFYLTLLAALQQIGEFDSYDIKNIYMYCYMYSKVFIFSLKIKALSKIMLHFLSMFFNKNFRFMFDVDS